MSVDGQFETIEQEIEALHDELDGCQRAIKISRVAVALGTVTLLLALTVVHSLQTPTTIFGAIAVMIGGTVWFGASKSSREEIEARLDAVEQRKARLFDAVAARNGWRDMTSTIR